MSSTRQLHLEAGTGGSPWLARDARTRATRLFFGRIEALGYPQCMTLQAPPLGLLRLPLRLLPAVAALLAGFLVLQERHPSALALTAIMVFVAVALEFGGWRRSVRQAPGILASAVLAGALVIGGVLGVAALHVDAIAPRVAQR